ncbi:helix-turn-helix domain-containing protein [Sphingomonas profundi]|uniref:helix-turn-helix domain-containing protein n=1 Tax=Alterirhizorhabdus profundi TaxID=2681549 RepID=UPI0012E93403|nr:helix-turn-helix transcriptional regulator [Sphingomonas profundi]
MIAEPLTAGAYLRRRRESAGLSIDDVAVLISVTDAWVTFNKALVKLIETDEHVPSPGFFDRLRGAFAFDRFVYEQLVCGPRPRHLHALRRRGRARRRSSLHRSRLKGTSMPNDPILPGLVPPLTPAEYIRLRREAAGLTIAQAAKPYYRRPEHAADVEATLRRAELPGAMIREDYLVDDYQRAFPFDPAVYRQLRDEAPAHHPTICRSCGCTSWTPCIGRDGEDCSIGEGLTCSVCEQKAHRRSQRRAA